MKPVSALGGLLLVIAGVGLPVPGAATTVRRAPVAQLATDSDVILHGVVRFVDDQLATGRDGPFLTAVEVEVLEVVAGLPPDTETLRLTLPGGRGFGRIARAPGMPKLAPGDEVVLLLEQNSLSFIFTGLGQGVFYVDRSADGPARVIRDLSGMNLVGDAGHGLECEATLEGLLTFLRGVVQGGER